MGWSDVAYFVLVVPLAIVFYAAISVVIWLLRAVLKRLTAILISDSRET